MPSIAIFLITDTLDKRQPSRTPEWTQLVPMRHTQREKLCRIGRQLGDGYWAPTSAMASPSFRGSDAPKFTPLAKSRSTACPPPIVLEYAPFTSSLCPRFVSSAWADRVKRFSINRSQPVKVYFENRGASSAA